MDLFLEILLSSAIVMSIVEDLRHQKIPNIVTYPTMALALVYQSLSGGINGFLFSAGGLALGIGIFIVPYIFGGMGAGDAKLMGAAGAILGPRGICIASIMVILAGGVYAVTLFIINPRYTWSLLKRTWVTFKTFALTAQFILIPPEKDEKQPVLRFAVPIAVGILAYTLMKATECDLVVELLGNKFKILSISNY